MDGCRYLESSISMLISDITITSLCTTLLNMPFLCRFTYVRTVCRYLVMPLSSQRLVEDEEDDDSDDNDGDDDSDDDDHDDDDHDEDEGDDDKERRIIMMIMAIIMMVSIVIMILHALSQQNIHVRVR